MYIAYLHVFSILDINIRLFFSLAAAGQLNKKANMATLKVWLGSQGVVVRSSAKKDEMVRMVLTKLGLDKTDVFEP